MDTGGARAPAGTLDVDCHGDGHEGRATLLPAAACALAALGVPVLLRLQRELPTARHGLDRRAGGARARRRAPARRAARGARRCVGAAWRRSICRATARRSTRLVALRPLFGVRTVAQTLMKLLDPLGCDARAVGVFHAPYLPSTATALATLGRGGLCVQALGGLPEAAPGKIVRVCRAGGEPQTLDLRALPRDVADRGRRARRRRRRSTAPRSTASRGADAAAPPPPPPSSSTPRAAREPLAAAADGAPRARRPAKRAPSPRRLARAPDEAPRSPLLAVVLASVAVVFMFVELRAPLSHARAALVARQRARPAAAAPPPPATAPPAHRRRPERPPPTPPVPRRRRGEPDPLEVVVNGKTRREWHAYYAERAAPDRQSKSCATRPSSDRASAGEEPDPGELGEAHDARRRAHKRI